MGQGPAKAGAFSGRKNSAIDVVRTRSAA